VLGHAELEIALGLSADASLSFSKKRVHGSIGGCAVASNERVFPRQARRSFSWVGPNARG